MAGSALEISQMSRFCEPFVTCNGYVRKENQRRNALRIWPKVVGLSCWSPPTPPPVRSLFLTAFLSPHFSKGAVLAVLAVREFQRLLQSKFQPVTFDLILKEPYGVKSVRKLIDGCAFRTYGHWVKRNKDEQQNRAALFENKPHKEKYNNGMHDSVHSALQYEVSFRMASFGHFKPTRKSAIIVSDQEWPLTCLIGDRFGAEEVFSVVAHWYCVLPNDSLLMDHEDVRKSSRNCPKSTEHSGKLRRGGEKHETPR